MKRAVFALTLLVCQWTAAPAAWAWDEKGHRVVALIAEHYLRPTAREQINALLGSDLDVLAGHDIASAATWADRYLESDRNSTLERFHGTVRWHYADIEAVRPNIPQACATFPSPKGLPASQGTADACIIDKIREFYAELANPKTPPGERLLALKFLLNLVADAHQPLRVATEHDDHGRRTPVSATTVGDSTLFDFWENLAIKQLDHDPVVLAEQLIGGIHDSQERLWASGTPQLWVLEAHQFGIGRGYGMLGRSDDYGRYILTTDDVAEAKEIVARQLSRAGVRLAYVLNAALAPAPAGVAVKAPPGNPQAGRAFVRVTCAVCHSVAPGHVASNDRTTAPDFTAIAQTPGMSEDALREFLFGPHPTMPSIALTGHEANDVIAYILSLKK